MRGKVNGHETQSSSGDASSSPPVAPQQLELPTPVCLSRIPPPGSARPGGHCCPPEPLSARTTLVPASAATPAPTHLFLLKPSCQGLCFAFAFPLVTAKRGETEGDGGRKCSVFLFVTVSVADTVCAAPPHAEWGTRASPPLQAMYILIHARCGCWDAVLRFKHLSAARVPRAGARLRRCQALGDPLGHDRSETSVRTQGEQHRGRRRTDPRLGVVSGSSGLWRCPGQAPPGITHSLLLLVLN